MIKAHNPLVFLVSLDLVFLRDLSKQFFKKYIPVLIVKLGRVLTDCRDEQCN